MMRKVPAKLIREELKGVPLYYKGYKSVMNGSKKLEDIMGSSETTRLDLTSFWHLSGLIYTYSFGVVTKLMLRFKPSNFVRLTGERRNISWNTSWVISSQSFRVNCAKSGWRLNSGVWCGRENRFHGQTSWQISQPKIQFSNFPFTSAGIASLSSIVK